jgi:hypothetical protein
MNLVPRTHLSSLTCEAIFEAVRRQSSGAHQKQLWIPQAVSKPLSSVANCVMEQREPGAFLSSHVDFDVVSLVAALGAVTHVVRH